MYNDSNTYPGLLVEEKNEVILMVNALTVTMLCIIIIASEASSLLCTI